MTAKELLYYYSCYCKDLQEAKNREDLKKNSAKGRANRVKIPMGKR
jgi:hypothetical protein